MANDYAEALDKMFRMVTRRVKKILAWVVAAVVVVLLFSGAWWLVTTFG